MTIRTKQEKYLWDIIQLGGKNVTNKDIYERNPEDNPDSIRRQLMRLKDRWLILREKADNNYTAIYRLNPRSGNRIKQMFKEELELNDYYIPDDGTIFDKPGYKNGRRQPDTY